MNVDGDAERFGRLEDRPELRIVEQLAPRVRVDHRALQPELLDRALELLRRGGGILRRHRRERGEAFRMSAYDLRHLVVAGSGHGERDRRIEQLHSRRGEQQKLLVDACGVHVADAAFADVEQALEDAHHTVARSASEVPPHALETRVSGRAGGEHLPVEIDLLARGPGFLGRNAPVRPVLVHGLAWHNRLRTRPTADYRIERDTFGDIRVPADRLWGAQTQRSLENFRISGERMPLELILALALVKRSCARVNLELKALPADKANAIAAAADEVLAGKHDGEFPLVVWQTGSGTQTNMNMNEVLANRASELLGGERGEKRLVHPNDEVNRGQSSNDVFPTAMSVAAVQALHDRLDPEMKRLRDTLAAKSAAFDAVVKIGRTHLQDATPLTLGQEISGWVSQLDHGIAHVTASFTHLCELALGGTAVGTGLNAHPEFGARVAKELGKST